MNDEEFDGWEVGDGDWSNVLPPEEEEEDRDALMAGLVSALRDTSPEALEERLPLWVGTTDEPRYRVTMHMVIAGPDIAGGVVDTQLAHLIVNENTDEHGGVPEEWVEEQWQKGVPTIMVSYVHGSDAVMQLWMASRIDNPELDEHYTLRATMWGIGRYTADGEE